MSVYLDNQKYLVHLRWLKAEMEANSPEAVAYGKAHETSVEHWSDCSVHNEPAFPAGPCDCVGFKSGK